MTVSERLAADPMTQAEFDEIEDEDEGGWETSETIARAAEREESEESEERRDYERQLAEDAARPAYDDDNVQKADEMTPATRQRVEADRAANVKRTADLFLMTVIFGADSAEVDAARMIAHPIPR